MFDRLSCSYGSGVDQEWAADKLERFISAIDTLMDPDFRGREDEFDNKARALEPVVQIIMEAVAPGLSKYESPDDARIERWSIRWRPAKNAALWALGLVKDGAEAKERMRPDAPELLADQLHEWVWEAARPMWEASSYSTAVLWAAQSINARLQQKLNRYDISDATLCSEAFKIDEPKAERPRLRFHGDRTSETWRSLQEGAGFFGRGCFQAIRNPVAHSHQHPVSEQEALEELAALSQLARWIDQCTVETASITA
jgi:Protein of unknown function (Hypoth_ymh)